ncbi:MULTISPECIES: ABC-F family ATP-binding cassette domain-containing protein [unclassified Clostridium]|uniref:ABC-F family ATP-binding cassette domain-containing protein n=1 Tax=unclassified Clostridium TaxID=2614128 RepID=UPI000E550950|nr:MULTISPECIES: ABC-F family ATP-binding cassette domain-containing protein [unclassified Clostridium]RHP47536.1 ABC transporter ATP-binding protein [Clostridium sp. AF32-12BH]RHV67976.1 ABC transporter ATP-binding protein [Clostridium sp. OM02-18AC]
MLYQITDGTVSVGGHVILSHVDFEIKGNEKIALVGRNGAGKTTLLKLIAGELSLDRDDRRQGAGVTSSRRLTVGMLKQQAFSDREQTVEKILLAACPFRDTFARERFEYEQEYDRIFTGFGFARADKQKKIGDFSGGEQTKIALIRLLLEKPDILLLDEPTNHLDIATIQWLEQYLKWYEHAVVLVSHDRFFLDQVAEAVVEVSDGKLTRYAGNYSEYRTEKRKRIERQQKAWERRKEEEDRLNGVIERFRHKPTKASFARAKKKQLERMERVEKPVEDDVHLFTGNIEPLIPGSKWVFEAEHLKIGYDRPLLEITLRIRRGQKLGILGANGAGKSTFLKTVAGLLQPFQEKDRSVERRCVLGNNITIGYFDQHSAEIQSDKSVAEHFHDLFPALTEKEVRNILGMYLFTGKLASRRVSDLSGGEKARLVLAELLQSRPNFLVLDEPTNHMDVQAKETLESAFQAYQGTILFVSHDRYFIRQVAQSVLIFEETGPMYYPFGYEHYLEKRQKAEAYGEELSAQVKAEDAALLEGMRTVPKAERHRLREFSTEEAYADWKLRLVYEKLEPEELEYGRLEAEYRGLLAEWKMSEAYWTLEQGIPDAVAAAKARQDEAFRRWHEQCMAWLGVYEEVHGETDLNV